LVSIDQLSDAFHILFILTITFIYFLNIIPNPNTVFYNLLIKLTIQLRTILIMNVVLKTIHKQTIMFQKTIFEIVISLNYCLFLKIWIMLLVLFHHLLDLFDVFYFIDFDDQSVLDLLIEWVTTCELVVDDSFHNTLDQWHVFI